MEKIGKVRQILGLVLIVAVGLVIVYVLLVSIPQLYQIIGRRLQNLVASALKKSSSSVVPGSISVR